MQILEQQNSFPPSPGEPTSSPGAVDRIETHWASRRQRHWEMLAIATFVIIASACLQVIPDERVAVVGWTEHPLPPSCLSRSLFGVRCPGCGLTRSLIHFVHGNLPASFQVHRIGWIMALAVALQVPYRLLALSRSRHEVLTYAARHYFAAALIGLLLLNWILLPFWN